MQASAVVNSVRST